MEYDCLKQLFQFYSFNIIPTIGEIIANNESAYQYLVESINVFPDQESFAIMLKDVGFTDVNYKNLTLGVAKISTEIRELLTIIHISHASELLDIVFIDKNIRN